jgi:hypothetical protein
MTEKLIRVYQHLLMSEKSLQDRAISVLPWLGSKPEVTSEKKYLG